jgi:uncharacterized protein YjbJ (UPF0337 family)
MNKQQIKGVTNQVTGGIKKGVGRMTGDTSTEARGHATEIKGRVQKGVGDAREDLREDREIERERRTRRDI